MPLQTATRDAILTLINIDSAGGQLAEIAAHTIRVIECNDCEDLIEFSDAARKREFECYTPAALLDLQLHAVNAILDCHGVEHLFTGETEVSHYHTDDCETLFSYANAGDTYCSTIAFDHSSGSWVVASLDDMITHATNERKASDDANCLEAALGLLGAEDGHRDYVIYTADEIGGKQVKVSRDDAIELGRRIIAADAARELDSESPDAVDPYSRWCADTESTILGETPADFEPEITLTAGDVSVRMQYRDGSSLYPRGDYRYEITANGATWYDDGLQSARMGFKHAADSVAGFQAMACSMLSFATTDEKTAECRAPESMQSALEDANCEVSEPEDGRDKPSGWIVVCTDDDGDEIDNYSDDDDDR